MCPGGTDQTERTAQRYTLLLPTIKQKYCRPDRAGIPVSRENVPHHEIPSWQFDVFQKLAKVPASSTHIDMAALAGVTTSLTNRQRSPLESLPPELLFMILKDAGLGKNDILSLGICSRLLWMNVLYHIRQSQNTGIAPWAGHPMIFTGSWLQTLPQPMHDLYPEIAEEEKRYRAQLGKRHRQGSFFFHATCGARWWNYKFRFECGIVSDESERKQWEQTLSSLTAVHFSPEVSAKLHEGLMKVLAPEVHPGKWRLRNLQTKECVRLTVDLDATKSKTTTFIEGSPWLSLDHMLLFQIVWACKNSARVEGPWAGHSFDIVPDSATSAEASDWTDKTHQIMTRCAWLKTLANATSGDDDASA